MDFLRLPKEIIIIIIKKLDTKSLLYLYNTCTYLQHLISMYNVVKICRLSLNSLATAQSLKLSFIKDISGHLQELDMCAVSDLSKTALLPALKKMKSLKTLNIAYTNITLLDLKDLFKACPTIKNIVTNFRFDKCAKTEITNEMLQSCRCIFNNLENVHFVGTYLNLLFSGLSPYILEDAELNSLTYTIVEKRASHLTAGHMWKAHEKLKFKNMNIYILNWENFKFRSILSTLDLEKYEFIFITLLYTKPLINTYKIYASPIFMNFFTNTLGVDVEYNLNIDAFQENIVIMLWDKEYVKFDDLFYKTLFIQLQNYFPCNYQSCDTLPMQCHNWFHLIPKAQYNEEKRDPVNYSPDFKKKRIVPENVTLNYDALFLEKESIELTLYFNGAIRNPVTLSPCSQYLKKITLLSLTGAVRYSSEFFKVLFQCCVNILTLNVEASVISPCALAISKSIQLSKSIKHLRLMDKRMDFKSLFISLSKCKTLENIHLHDMSTESSNLADPTVLFEQCENLYHLFIFAFMTETTKTKNLRLFHKVKSKYKRSHLNLELYSSRCDVKYSYDAYINIFKLIPIRLCTV